jgi:hypothetical protein
MSLFTRFGDWVIARAQRTPYFHLDGYMERYWLFRIGRFGQSDNQIGSQEPRALLAARVHHILRGDAGRHFHDHPWSFIALRLRGGYTEVRPVFDRTGRQIGETRRYHGPGTLSFRRATDWHRLDLEPGTTVWTLFIMFPLAQRWGFLVDGLKVYYRTFLFGEPDPGPLPSAVARFRAWLVRRLRYVWEGVKE